MAEEMTGRERVLAVLKRREPDCVPTFEWDIDLGVIARLCASGRYEDFVEEYDLDAVTCSPDYARHPVGDGMVRDEWGVTRRKGHEAYAMPVDELAPIKNWADLEHWRPPDAGAADRLATLQRRVSRFKGQKAILIQLRDVFSNPRDLMGYVDFLAACVAQPDLVSGVVEKCIDHSIQLVERAAEVGAEVIVSGDDIADNRATLVSPKVWDRLFMPHFRRWVQAIHAAGLYHWKHTDGNIMKVIGSLVDAGIDGIDPIDPLGNMDLATIKTLYGDRVAIKGNVDCAELLVNGSEEDVVQAVKACIRTAGPGGGYACSSSNSIHSGVRPELYVAMLRAIREYGTYPLDMDRLA